MIAYIRLVALTTLILLACKKEETTSAPPANPLIGGWDLQIAHTFDRFGTRSVEREDIKWSFQNNSQLQMTVNTDFSIASFFPMDSLYAATKDTVITYQLIDSTEFELFGETYTYFIDRNILRLVRGNDHRAKRFYFRKSD